MICYHGTTEKGLKAIVEGGRKPSIPWNVSDNDGYMYIWPTDKLESEWEPDEIEHQGVQMGFESAQIQAAVTQEETLIVIALDIPEDLLSDDLSCENMERSASCILCADFDKSMIIKTFKCEMNKWLFPFVIKGLLQNQHFNSYCVEDNLLKIAEMLPDDSFMEETLEFDWQQV